MSDTMNVILNDIITMTGDPAFLKPFGRHGVCLKKYGEQFHNDIVEVFEMIERFVSNSKANKISKVDVVSMQLNLQQSYSRIYTCVTAMNREFTFYRTSSWDT